MNHPSVDQSPVNWFDLLVVITILLGIRQGRKTGMSVEMLVMFQWIAIVAFGALLYGPLGGYLSDVSPLSHLWSFIIVYVIIAIAVKGFFTFIKKGVGGKLTGSDVFGRAEFYLGMGAGAVRFLCILIFALAMLNAPKYSSQQIASNRAYQLDNYGSEFFPGFAQIQSQIFQESFLGTLLKKHAEFILIAPTKPEPGKGMERRKDGGY